jgi:hypothetical protein
MSVDPEVRVCEWTEGRADYPFLPTVGFSGMTFEVRMYNSACLFHVGFSDSGLVSGLVSSG